MLSRASRILNKTVEEKKPTKTPGNAAAAARLSESERVLLWERLLRKVSIIFQTLYQQRKARLLLGEKVYDHLFQKEVTAASSKPTPALELRFLRGEVVGKALDPGAGKVDKARAHMDAAMCQHPDSAMKTRSNGKQKWWACIKCLSRWERLSVNEVPAQNLEASDQTLVTFGKHAGETFLETYQTDKQYCQWVQSTVENENSSVEFQRLAAYIHTKELEETYEMDGFEYTDVGDEEL